MTLATEWGPGVGRKVVRSVMMANGIDLALGERFPRLEVATKAKGVKGAIATGVKAALAGLVGEMMEPKKKTDGSVVASRDPNAISGPLGVSDARIIAALAIPYLVQFENVGTAPAGRLHITVPLSTFLDPSTVLFGAFGMNNRSFLTTGRRRPFLQERLDLIGEYGVYVDVFARVDMTTREAIWTFQAIDPLTNLPPTGAFAGFLPKSAPNSTSGVGHGFVEFSVSPRDNVTSSTQVTATASIVFDDNLPVVTEPTMNTLDILPPSSTVSVDANLSTLTTTVLNFNWTDDLSGVDSLSLFLSEDNSAFRLVEARIQTASYVLQGLVPGVSYAFLTVAVDKVGNVEPMKADDAHSLYSLFVPTCFSRNNCSGAGVCMDTDFCLCATGFTDLSCSTYTPTPDAPIITLLSSELTVLEGAVLTQLPFIVESGSLPFIASNESLRVRVEALPAESLIAFSDPSAVEAVVNASSSSEIFCRAGRNLTQPLLTLARYWHGKLVIRIVASSVSLISGITSMESVRTLNISVIPIPDPVRLSVTPQHGFTTRPMPLPITVESMDPSQQTQVSLLGLPDCILIVNTQPPQYINVSSGVMTHLSLESALELSLLFPLQQPSFSFQLLLLTNSTVPLTGLSALWNTSVTIRIEEGGNPVVRSVAQLPTGDGTIQVKGAFVDVPLPLSLQIIISKEGYKTALAVASPSEPHTELNWSFSGPTFHGSNVTVVVSDGPLLHNVHYNVSLAYMDNASVSNLVVSAVQPILFGKSIPSSFFLLSLCVPAHFWNNLDIATAPPAFLSPLPGVAFTNRLLVRFVLPEAVALDASIVFTFTETTSSADHTISSPPLSAGTHEMMLELAGLNLTDRSVYDLTLSYLDLLHNPSASAIVKGLHYGKEKGLLFLLFGL